MKDFMEFLRQNRGSFDNHAKHSVEITKIYSALLTPFWQNIRENNVFTKEIPYELI